MVTITPELLASSGTESGHQKALFCWANLNLHLYPELGLMFAIPNGGLRSAKTASRMKAEGAKSGVPDICLPIARGQYHGLFVEMKTDRGHVSPAQRAWHENLMQQRYLVIVCRSWQEAVNDLVQYISRKN